MNRNLLAAAAALLFAGQASAALLAIGSGSPFATPTKNNVLAVGTPMIDRATLTTTAGATLSFYFLGSESGYKNTLNLAGGFTHTEPANAGQPYPSVWANAQLLTTITVDAAGNVPMWFTSSGWGSGFTLAPGPGTATRSIAFSYLDCLTGKSTAGANCAQTGTPTNMVLFALDDDGANVDDNHDDYVGFIVANALPESTSVVPLPAAVWLLGSGLLGLLGIGRRRAS